MGGTPIRARAWVEGLEGATLLFLAVATWPLTRFLLADLGSRPDERARAWPGDDLLARCDVQTARALPVPAPAERVWPWLVQIGLGRGGFHSYELIERLGGLSVRNVEELRPELQELGVGDEVVFHPSAPPLSVAVLEPPHVLCLRTWRDEEDLARRDPPWLGTWSLHVVPAGEGVCRLLLRSRKEHRRPRSLGARLVAVLLEEPLDLVMERRMLRTVRRLAESGAAGAR
jgi:hypothetical protein